MAMIVLHLATNVAVAVAAAALTYWSLMDVALFGDSPTEAAGSQAFTQIAATTAACATLMLLSTYHRRVKLDHAPRTLLQRVTAILVLGSWGFAGYLASMALGEGLMFYGFLAPPLTYLTTSYLDEPVTGTRQVVWRDPWSALRQKFYRR